MTTSELCELFSEEISHTFDLSKDVIEENLFEGLTPDMTEEQIYSRLIMKSILISSNLSTQVIINGLVSLGVISKDFVDSLKLHPKLHLVQPPNNNCSSADSEE